jgi:hypothetical protein
MRSPQAGDLAARDIWIGFCADDSGTDNVATRD